MTRGARTSLGISAAVLVVVGIIAAFVILAPAPSLAPSVPVRTPPPIAEYPHDTTSYTQGLAWHQGLLYESTGGYGASAFLTADLLTGRALWRESLPRRLFGEGLARTPAGEWVQLTWREGIALRWRASRAGAELTGRDAYQGEGWGLARVGDVLVVSDGSARLQLRDPRTFAICAVREVRDGDTPVRGLNELEWVGDALWANIYGSDRIAVIDLRGGRVREWVDLRGLRARLPQGSGAEVLNGIAWDPPGRRVLVTGKRWPRLFALAGPGPQPAPPLSCPEESPPRP